MKYIGFLFFALITIRYIWNGKDFFGKKEWVNFGLRFVGVAVGIAVLGFIIKGSLAAFPDFSRATAKFILVGFSVSSIMVLGLKYLVVMMCAIFGKIMNFHKVHNQENYKSLSGLTNEISPPLLTFLKCLLSVVSVIIFYGIWLAKS